MLKTAKLFKSKRPFISNFLSYQSKRSFHHSNVALNAKRVLVLAEHDNKTLNGSTLNTIGAATRLNPSEGIDVFIAGSDCDPVVEQLKKVGNVSRVIVRKSPKYQFPLAEPLANLLKNQVQKNLYSHVLAPSTSNGKNILPRLAALIDVQPISDVIDILSDDTFMRPIYAGNAIATVQSKDKIKVLSIRTTSFNQTESQGEATVEEISDQEDGEVNNLSTYISSELAQSERPDLTAARVVISGGRGLKNGDNFKLLYDLADQLGNSVAIGASRAAVDDGFAPNDLQVGQTGKIVAPELYIAVGISGAIQHLAGMKDSKVIVAINKDEEAPIFQIADYGLVDDLFKAVPQLTETIKNKK